MGNLQRCKFLKPSIISYCTMLALSAITVLVLLTFLWSSLFPGKGKKSGNMHLGVSLMWSEPSGWKIAIKKGKRFLSQKGTLFLIYFFQKVWVISILMQLPCCFNIFTYHGFVIIINVLMVIFSSHFSLLILCLFG